MVTIQPLIPNQAATTGTMKSVTVSVGDPCCECGGDGRYFQVRCLVPSLDGWDFRGGERPRCTAKTGT